MRQRASSTFRQAQLKERETELYHCLEWDHSQLHTYICRRARALGDSLRLGSSRSGEGEEDDRVTHGD